MAPAKRKVRLGSLTREYLKGATAGPSLVGPVRQYLLLHPSTRVDTTPTLHPSSISHKDWCPRASYYAFSPAYPTPPAEPLSLVQEDIFALGNDLHARWQTWAWKVGILRGEWLCVSCGSRFNATAPGRCPDCGAPQAALRYAEVPFSAPEYMVEGKADGDIGTALIEIKTVGVGTIRYSAPGIYNRHVHRIKSRRTGKVEEVLNLNGLWRDIHAPFPDHYRQGQLYMHFLGRSPIVYVYDCKFLSVEPKEFVVERSPKSVHSLLDSCLDVRYALEKERPPYRPSWASLDHKTCQGCFFRETCYENEE